MKIVFGFRWKNLLSKWTLLVLAVSMACDSTVSKKQRKLSHLSVGCDMGLDHFHDFLKSGDMKGFFTYEQFWHYWNELHHQYPNFISDKFVVGKTFFDDDMHGFYFGEQMQRDKPKFTNKNIVFITGLHHSREPLTVTMILYIMIEILRGRGVCGGSNQASIDKWKTFFETNVIFFIPMVNIDSYKFINSNWQGEHGKEALMIRKNRNVSPSCSIYTGGVDLNRNYSFMFGADDLGSSSSACDEDYRGTAPFSEPETQAIKDYVDSHDTIVTAINMHTYGNAWVYPFNFVHDKNNLLLKKQKPKFYKFYEEFVHQMKQEHIKATYGNAQSTVQYPTNGEAGDWITEIYNVINLDVELGNLDKRSERFYPPKSIIPQILEYNFQVFRRFFWSHNIDLRLHQVLRNTQRKTFTFILFNKSISSLIDFKAHVVPQFVTKARKLRKRVKLRDQPWHVIHFGSLGKHKERSRKLTNSDNHHSWSLKYAVGGSSKTAKDGYKAASDGTFDATLVGRNYLSLQFTFEDVRALQEISGLNLTLKYGADHSKIFYFDSYATELRTASKRMLKDIPAKVLDSEKIQDKKLKSDSVLIV